MYRQNNVHTAQDTNIGWAVESSIQQCDGELLGPEEHGASSWNFDDSSRVKSCKIEKKNKV